jgi:hypothetical protein
MTKTIFTIFKISLILLASLIISKIEIDNERIKYQELINLIITINGILIAVIATFLYSKILVERAERIQIKINIDNIGLKINALRKIAKYLRSSSNFWIKPTRVISRNYPKINIFSLRTFNSDQLNEFLEKNEMGELNSQAFLATKFLEGEGSDVTKISINPNYRKNYTTKTLSEYIECCSFIYSYCEEYSEHISIEDWSKVRIKKELKKMNYELDKITPKKIGEFFSDFSTSEIEKQYKLTVEISKGIGNIFQWIFVNILFSFIILLTSMLGLIYFDLTGLSLNFIVIGTIWIISDLILNTFYSLRKEIRIEQFYN